MLVMIVRVALVACMVLQANVRAQARESEFTIDVMNRLTAERLEMIVDSLDRGGYLSGGSVALDVSPGPDAYWVESEFLRILQSKNVTVLKQAETQVNLVVKELRTMYSYTPSSDTVERLLRVHIEAIARQGETVRLISAPIAEQRDTLSRTDALRKQSTQRSSLYAELPPEKRTMWEDILEPAVFIVAAVTTVVLLFTVRSQ